MKSLIGLSALMLLLPAAVALTELQETVAVLKAPTVVDVKAL